MTKKEFILKAMLSMAANTEYVETKFNEDENGNTVAFPALMTEIIFIDAEALANEAEKRMDRPFEDGSFESDKSLKTVIEHIEESLCNPLTVVIDE